MANESIERLREKFKKYRNLTYLLLRRRRRERAIAEQIAFRRQSEIMRTTAERCQTLEGEVVRLKGLLVGKNVIEQKTAGPAARGRELREAYAKIRELLGENEKLIAENRDWKALAGDLQVRLGAGLHPDGLQGARS